MVACLHGELQWCVSDHSRTKGEVVITSYASGSWGCGAWTQTSWFQYKWPDNCDLHISFKELLALVLEASVWGKSWGSLQVQWRCDNQAALRVTT